MNTFEPRQRFSPKFFSAVIFAALGAYLAIYLVYFSAWPIDDSFIAMRVARNFSNFGNPYFNLDDPVLGTSCHTWILLLSAGFSAVGAKISLVVALELIIVLALLHYCAEILRENFSRNTSLLLAFLAIHLVILPFAALLRETPLVFLFFCLAILFARDEKYFAAGIFAALAAFTRNEFVLFSLLLLFFQRKNHKFWLGQAAVVIPMLAFLVFFYRTVIPQPLFAKALFASIPPLEKAAQMLAPVLQVTSETGKVFFFPGLSPFLKSAFNLAAAPLLAAAAAVLLWRQSKLNYLYASMAAFPILLSACYLRNSAWIPVWYWPHVMFPLLLWGLLQCRRAPWLSLAFLALCSGRVPLQVSDFLAVVTNRPEKRSLAPLTSRTLQYLEIGRQLDEARLPCKSVYATEIGALGWSFPGNITDALGLVSSSTFESLRHLPPSKEVIRINTLLPLLKSDPPCLIVSLPAFIKPQISEEELEKSYRVFSRTPLTVPFHDFKEILVWQRL